MNKKLKKYQVGGATKTYTNKAEYDKALQAYNDSLEQYNWGHDINVYNNAVPDGGKLPGDNVAVQDNLQSKKYIPKQQLSEEGKQWAAGEWNKKLEQRKKELSNYYSKEGMFSVMKEPVDIDSFAEKSLRYNESPTSEKFKTATIDVSLGVAPELLLSKLGKVPQVKQWYDNYHKGTLKNNIPGNAGEYIQRGVADEKAIKDLLETGIVRNRQSAGLPSKGRWGENVYWGNAGDKFASNNYNIIAKNSKELSNRPVTLDDIKDLQIKTSKGYKSIMGEKPWLKATGQKFAFGGKILTTKKQQSEGYNNPENKQYDWLDFPGTGKRTFVPTYNNQPILIQDDNGTKLLTDTPVITQGNVREKSLNLPTMKKSEMRELYNMIQSDPKLLKFCMGGRKKYQTGGPQNTLTTMPTIQPGQVQNNYMTDNTNNSVPQLNAPVGGSTKTSSSPNYLNMATSALGNIGVAADNYQKATTSEDKTNAVIGGTTQTVRGVVDTTFPIVGAVDMAAGAVGQVVDATNPTQTYTTKDGKQINYKDEDHAASFKSVTDPWGSVTNGIESFAGTKENYGRSDLGMGLLDIFGMQWISEGLRNQDAKKARNNDISQNMNYDPNAQAQFAKYGGKLKFQEGGIPPEMMAAMQGGDPAAMQQAPQPPPPYVETWKDIAPSMKISSKLKPIEYKGRTHKYGGINVSDQSELEHGEYSVNLKDPQTGAPVRYIFSAETGFAARAKKIMSDYGPQYT